MKPPRVVFLFTNPREEVISRIRAGRDADTSLWGFNHIPHAEYLVASPTSLWSLRLVPRLLSYDFIVAQDCFLLGYIVSFCARIFRRRTRWLYVTVTSSTLIRRHRAHPMRLFLLKKFWASYARIICISSEQREDLIQLGIARERLVFIPFGVDANFFQPTDTSSEDDLVMSVGRDAGRDYATLFGAAERTNHKFVIVAGRSNIPADRQIPPNVTVLYNRSLFEIRDLYARAKLAAVASKSVNVPDGSDCSGQTAILDALAAGKAVIATRRPWITDYFVPNEDLVVVEPNDPETLARAIDSLSTDTEKRKLLSASGHTKVAKNYTTTIFANALYSLMNSYGND